MTPESSVESLESRKSVLDDWIRSQLENGKITYDRSSILQPGYAELKEDASHISIEVPSLSSLEKQYETKIPKKCHGTCREIAPYLKQRLPKEGLVDESAILGCADPDTKEAHYVNLNTIEAKKFLVDMGYSQPVPLAIPIDGSLVESDYYPSVEKAQEQVYSGKVIYQATEDENGNVLFAITKPDGTVVKSFKFEPMTEDLDEKIIEQFIKATGKAYETRVKDGKMEKNNLGDDKTDQEKRDMFMELHKKVTDKTQRKALEIMFK